MDLTNLLDLDISDTQLLLSDSAYNLEKGKPYILFTLVEPINLGEFSATDNGSSKVWKFKKSKKRYIKEIFIPVPIFVTLSRELSREKPENNQDNSDLDDSQILKWLLKFVGPSQKQTGPSQKLTLILLIDQLGKDYTLCIPPSNIAHAAIGSSYPDDRFFRWQSYKNKGKKIIKVFAIIMGLILAITQIVVNVVTIS